jgi:hypothetical protein
MERWEAAMLPRYALSPYCVIPSPLARGSPSPGAPYSNGVTSDPKSICGSVPPPLECPTTRSGSKFPSKSSRLFRRFRQKKKRKPRMPSTAMPPTAPPTIAPVWEDDLVVLEAVVVDWAAMAVVVYMVVIGTPLLDLGKKCQCGAMIR